MSVTVIRCNYFVYKKNQEKKLKIAKECQKQMSNWTSTLAIDLFFFFFVRFRHLSNNRCVSVLRWFLIVFSPFSAFCVVTFRRRKKCERKQQQEVAYQSMLSNCVRLSVEMRTRQKQWRATPPHKSECVCARAGDFTWSSAGVCHNGMQNIFDRPDD